jgi:hypothetical protein
MTYVVPALVNHATQKVAIFEGSTKMREQLIHWVELKQGIHQLRIWRTRVDVENVAKSDDTTHTSKEDMLFHKEGIGGALVLEVHGHNVKRKNL